MTESDSKDTTRNPALARSRLDESRARSHRSPITMLCLCTAEPKGYGFLTVVHPACPLHGSRC